MDAIEAILRAYAWNLHYAAALVADLAPELWTRTGGPGLPNHPAWTLGHLCTGSSLVAMDLGLASTLPQSWRDLFERRGPGDPRVADPDPSLYPPGEELLTTLGELHTAVERAVRGTAAERFDAPAAWRFGSHLPSEGDSLLFMLVTHEALHLGQLEAWRRHHGLRPALARL